MHCVRKRKRHGRHSYVLYFIASNIRSRLRVASNLSVAGSRNGAFQGAGYFGRRGLESHGCYLFSWYKGRGRARHSFCICVFDLIRRHVVVDFFPPAVLFVFACVSSSFSLLLSLSLFSSISLSLFSSISLSLLSSPPLLLTHTIPLPSLSPVLLPTPSSSLYPFPSFHLRSDISLRHFTRIALPSCTHLHEWFSSAKSFHLIKHSHESL